ncbi:MAG: hypothetical protein IT363_12210 [Methanoregulaceae archaeon]|nr:hypothetical protein [Methanoregulaceae archaeon]
MVGRVLMVASIVVLSAVASALPIIWTKSIVNGGVPKIIRDTSGNFYQVTPVGTLYGRELVVTKYNALGTAAWSTTISETSFSGNQFSVRGLALTATSLVIVAHERTVGGAGSFVSSRMFGVNLANGGNSFFGSSLMEYAPPAATPTQIAILLRDTSTNDTSVAFFDATFSVIATVGIGQSTRIGVVTIDTANNAYAASGLADGTSRVTRCNSTGVAYQTNFDILQRNTETPVRIVADPVGNRVYALVFGLFETPPNDMDAFLYFLNMTTGQKVSITSVNSSTDDDDPYDLSIAPGGGVIASVGRAVVNECFVRRLDSEGNYVWNLTITNTPVPSPRSHAFDTDGNFLISNATWTGQDARIDRINTATGALINTHQFFVGATTVPRELITDAAGNFYLTSTSNRTTLFQRIQVADLSFTANNVTGGTPVEGRIDVAQVSQSDQTWLVSSSNPSVVSVPASVVLPATHPSVTFPLTVQPVASNTNVSINVRNGGFISQKTLTIIPSNIQSLSISPQVVIGGIATEAKVTLGGTAPVGGRTVMLVSNKPAVASVPASVVVPAGDSVFDVPVTTYGVNANQGVVITATTGAVSRSAFFAVNAPSLTSISVNPSTLQGGSLASLTLNISGIAPAGGFSIVLISGAPGVVFLSASASIPAGQVTHNVNVPTASVSSSLNVTVFATRSGIYRTTTLTVTP